MKDIQVGIYTVSFEDFDRWLSGLRSGNYKQSHGKLERAEGLCCLGVGCKIFIPEEQQTRTGTATNFGTNSLLCGTLPSEQTSAPKWLQEINSDFERKTGAHLFDLNDSMRLSFEEIADSLEAVYIHKVLE